MKHHDRDRARNQRRLRERRGERAFIFDPGLERCLGEVELPADAFVLGEPVALLEVDYDGNERRGLTARCRREDGSEHLVSFADVRFAPGSNPARYAAAYRTWLGVEEVEEAPGPPRRQRRHKVAGEVEGARLDVAALGLVPLRLEDRGIWNPRDEEWTAKGTPLEPWEQEIMARGPRPEYEMEQVLPGVDPADWDADPILDAVEL